MAEDLLYESDRSFVVKGFPFPKYIQKTDPLSESEKELCDAIINVLKKKKSVNDVSFEKNPKDLEIIFKKTFRQSVFLNIPPAFFTKMLSEEERKFVTELLEEYLKTFTDSPKKLADEIVKEVFGMGVIDSLLEDEELEEIMVNGPEENVFVYHKKAGMCVTNIRLTKKEIAALIKKVSLTRGKVITEKTPFLDAQLPSGDRFNAVLESVSPFGPTITIRKFRRMRFTVPDLIRNGTFTPEICAFLWIAVEGFRIAPRNIIIAGGTSAGKTSTLDALLDFVPLDERLITVEDTRELDPSGRKNWVPLVTKPGVDMDSLLRNALRMRPDRIIVGEVRGPEAETLFVAMDVGHNGTMGTLHANTSREVLTRLKNPPMNVPENLLPLMNIILVQHRFKTPEGLIRRVTELTEVAHMDDKVLLSSIFRMNPKTKKIERIDVPSRMIEELSWITGLTKQEVKKEIENREILLKWAAENIKTREEFVSFVNTYYISPEEVWESVS